MQGSPFLASRATSYPSKPPCQAELIEPRPHSKERPEQPASREKHWVPVRPSRGVAAGFQGGPSHAKRHVGEEVRECYLCNCVVCRLCRWCSRKHRARCVGSTVGTYTRGKRSSAICLCLACRKTLLGRPTETPARAAQPLQDPPAAFCCRDIERSVVAPGHINDGYVGGFCLPFSCEFRAVLKSAACLTLSEVCVALGRLADDRVRRVGIFVNQFCPNHSLRHMTVPGNIYYVCPDKMCPSFPIWQNHDTKSVNTSSSCLY